MSTLLPKDDNGNPIQALRPETAQKFNVTATTARTASAFAAGTSLITICATQDCYFKLGGSAVAATTSDHFLPANRPRTIHVGPHTYVAAIRASADGVFHVSENV